MAPARPEPATPPQRRAPATHRRTQRREGAPPVRPQPLTCLPFPGARQAHAPAARPGQQRGARTAPGPVCSSTALTGARRAPALLASCGAVCPAARRSALPAGGPASTLPPRPPTNPLTHHSDAHSASVARRLSPSRVRGESRDGGGASSSPRVVVRLARDRAAAEGRSPVGILPCPDGVAPLPPLRVALRPLSACAGSGAPRELPARPLPRGLTAQPAPPRPPLLPPPAPYPASRPG